MKTVNIMNTENKMQGIISETSASILYIKTFSNKFTASISISIEKSDKRYNMNNFIEIFKDLEKPFKETDSLDDILSILNKKSKDGILSACTVKIESKT